MLDLIPPKLYVNGFPKAGLNLAVRMALPMFPDSAIEETVWFGTNAWVTERGRLDEAADILGKIEPATYLMGHTGHLPELEQLLNELKILMLFVYRDLRDVVVSQTYHILDDKGGMLKHPGRNLYSTDKHEVMLQCINGIENYPGVFERWETYEPWLDVPAVFSVRFEEMIKKPQWVAKRFFEWIYEITIAETGEKGAYIDKDLKNCIVDYMVNEMKQKHLSITFRKGKMGSWKREFTPAVAKAFEAADTGGYMERLGYH